MITVKIPGASLTKSYDSKVASAAVPDFVQYKEDIAKITAAVEPYQKYSKILVIGNGGSITTIAVYIRALKGNGKRIFLLNSNDPDLIANLKKDYTQTNTVVVVVSKSGQNISNLEAALQFSDYPGIAVTESTDNPLRQIVPKLNWTIIDHSPIGGRFSSFSASALVPAALFGLPLDRILTGARTMQQLCANTADAATNPAWQIASTLNRLATLDYDELFVPIYSYYLETSIPLLMQLFHETLGKSGKGWSVIAALAPESQHHTNQRFFGGRKNMVGMFVTVKNLRDQTTQTTIPQGLENIPLRDGTLSQLGGISLAKALSFEYEATKQDALEQKIPLISVELDKIDSAHIGEYIALWQMVVYYLALLQGVDPFNQPQVERSKNISWQLRKVAHKG